ncbi:MAG TPA: hypothetical protein VGF87_02420 [Acidimicrobiales bacterium]|jgi:hypothetical protein
MTDPTEGPAHRAQHAAPSAGGSVARRRQLVLAGIVGVIVLVVVLVLVLGGSSPKNGAGQSLAATNNTVRLTSANNTALNQLNFYEGQVTACKKSITCIEKADRNIGNQIHTYANYVGTIKTTSADKTVVQDALNTAQVTANIFEVLGDAEPTQSNYNTVLHHFDLQSQIQKLQTAINNLASAISS